VRTDLELEVKLVKDPLGALGIRIRGWLVASPVVASWRMCWIFHFDQNSLDLEGGMGR